MFYFTTFWTIFGWCIGRLMYPDAPAIANIQIVGRNATNDLINICLMAIEQQNYANEFIRKIKFKIRIFPIFVLTVALIASLFFLFTTMSDTISLGKLLLGQERYDARMNDSYIGSIGIFGMIMVMMMIPMLLLHNRFRDRDISVINNFSGKDIDKLKKSK